MLSDVTREDLEVYVGKWFENGDPETKELQELLSNGKNVFTVKTLAKDGGMTQERLKELGLKLIWERNTINNIQKRRWKLISVKK